MPRLGPRTEGLSLEPLELKNQFLLAVNANTIPIPDGDDREVVRAYYEDYVRDYVKKLADLGSRDLIDEAKGVLSKIQDELVNSNGLLSDLAANQILVFIVREFNTIFSSDVFDAVDTSDIDVVDTKPEKHKDVTFFIGLGGKRVPNFFKVKDSSGNWEPIDIYKDSFSERERQKIVEDFYWLLMTQINEVIFPDIASNKNENYAAPSNLRLRVYGSWNQGSDSFAPNPNPEGSSIPKTLDDWDGVLRQNISNEMADLFDTARRWVRSYVEINNQAQVFLDVVRSGAKEPDEKKVIEAFSHQDVTFSLERLFSLITGAGFRGEDGRITNEKLAGAENVFSELYGDIHEITQYLFHISSQRAKISIDGITEDVAIPEGFPHFKGNNAEAMYLKVKEIVLTLVKRSKHYQEIKEKFDDKADDQLEKIIDWAIQGAFNTTWGFGIGIKYDNKAFATTFAEWNDIYHDHGEDGRVAKTADVPDESSKNISPAACERAEVFLNPLETIYLPVIIRKDTVDIGEGKEAIRKYFEEYLENKYGNNFETSREYRSIKGKFPRSVFYTTDSNGNQVVNYAAIAERLMTIRVKPEATKLGVSGDILLIERNDPSVIRGYSNENDFFTVRINAYDAFYRALLPKIDDTTEISDDNQKRKGLSLIRWSNGPEKTKSNYNEILYHENTWWVTLYNLKKLNESPIPYNLRDILEWEPDEAAQIIGITKSAAATFENASRYSRRAGKAMLSILGIQDKVDRKSLLGAAKKLLGIHDGGGGGSALDKKYVDIGSKLFDKARGLVRVQEDTVPAAVARSGFAQLNDKLKSYYIAAYLGNQSNVWPVVEQATANDGSVEYKVQVETDTFNEYDWPLAFDEIFRNVLVAFHKHPSFISERAAYCRRIARDGKKDKKDRAIAQFVLIVDQIIFSIVSAYYGKYMYHYDQRIYKKGENDLDSIMDNYYHNPLHKRPITEDLPIAYPEDIEAITEILVEEIKMLAGSFARKFPELGSNGEDFLRLTTNWFGGNTHLSNMDLTVSNVRKILLSIPAFKGISAGPAAGGTALDYINLVMTGKAGPWQKTAEQVEQEFKLRPKGFLGRRGKDITGN